MRVAVVGGGGVAGRKLAKELPKLNLPPNVSLDVTFYERQAEPAFSPLLPKLIDPKRNPADITKSMKAIIGKNQAFTSRQQDVTNIDVDAKRVTDASGATEQYDWIILAPGLKTNYYGRTEYAELAPGLKTPEDGLRLRHRLVSSIAQARIEKAEGLEASLAKNDAKAQAHAQRCKELLTFVVVGGGPTGCEIASMLAYHGNKLLKDDPELAQQLNVVIAQSNETLVPANQEENQKQVGRDLLDQGVTILTNTKASSVTRDGVELSFKADPRAFERSIRGHAAHGATEPPEPFIQTPNKFWTAGVRAADVCDTLGVEQDRMGRIHVTENLSIPGHPEVFVVGDCARSDSNGSPVPPVGTAAEQMAVNAAKNIEALLAGELPQAFAFKDPGSVVDLNPDKGVAELVICGHRFVVPFWLADAIAKGAHGPYYSTLFPKIRAHAEAVRDIVL